MSMPAQDSQQARHRATGGRGYGREAGEPGVPSTYTPPRREGGRHRAPDAAPSTEFANVPMQQRGSLDSPPSGFRRLPPAFPTTGAVPAQAPPGGTRPTSDVGAASRPPESPAEDARHGSGGTPLTSDAGRSPRPPEAPTEDEPVTTPVRRTDLDRARRRADHAAVPRQRPAADSSLRALSVRPTSGRVGPGAFGTGSYGSTGVGPARARTPVAARQPLPWERRLEGRTGLVGTVVGAIGVLIGLAPWSGLLPRVMPADALGSTPLFNLVGALFGVAALGIGAFAMFRADGVGRGLYLGVGAACLGAAAVVVGLTV
ncbi:hypothetical protein [Actinomycetospora termitidis]|uniref:Uncharacterized protein n=1 Tax=Actinomycetospora termitidis TaxID=3053470 RepID=A0ABT7M2W2_9PSEU|nr:hypothetical protein [Actinomycetospora sp. Odt1-22]MDL5155000.1 hypothetical protein [Actinomycetospora sp. Odt1-22]